LLRNFRDGDCFHNGEKALRAVQRCHKEICDSLGRHDHITERTIDVLIKEMLGESAGRPTAMMVWIKSQRILGEAQEALDQGIEVLKRSRGQTFPQHQPNPPLPPQLPPGKSRDFRQHFQTGGSGFGHMIDPRDDQNTVLLNGEQSHSPESIPENGNDPLVSPAIQLGMHGEPITTASLVKMHHASDGQVSYGGTGESFSDEDQMDNTASNRQFHSTGTPSQARGSQKGVSFDTYTDRKSAPNLPTGIIGATIGKSTTGSLTRHARDLDRGKGREKTFEPFSYEAAETVGKHRSKGSSSSSTALNLHDNGQDDWQNLQAAQMLTPTSQPSSPEAASPQDASPRSVGHKRETSKASSSGLSQQEPYKPHTSSKPEPAKEASSEELPLLSVMEALAWKVKKKRGMVARLNGEHLIERLEKRDHVSIAKHALFQHRADFRL